MIIYQFYNANVLSSLLNEEYNNIRNLKDLLESGLKVGVEDMLFNKDYFKRTTDRIPLELYNKKIVRNKQNNFFDAEFGMSLVKRGGYAFHVDTSAAYRIMRRTFSEREICEVNAVTLFPPQYVGAVAKKGSQYKEYIAIGVSKMLESGLMNRIKSIWDSRKPPCVKMRYSSIISVNIREFSMALLFLMCGFTIAIIILLCEIYTIKIKREKRSKIKFYRRKLPSEQFKMYKTKRIKKNRVLCLDQRTV
ncbi:unnamed protein product [Parnassius mnemosyne]|uniref:Uncharacterized protein n=1 Tax=Parnassius mnemosyne TaxID=213953 RepID=A0AAV1KMI7_9NEOP